MDGPIGCLMGVIAVDAPGASPKLLTAVQAFFDEWAQAFAHLYRCHWPAPQAERLGQQMVALYEGAILMARTYQDPQRIRQAGELALSWLDNAPAATASGAG